MRINYTLTDSSSASCNFTTDSAQVQYATDLGGPWNDATLYGITFSVASSSSSTTHNFTFEPLYWDATGVSNGDYYLKIKPYNGTDYATNYAVSGSTVKIYNPTAGNFMRHGKTFLDEVKQFFYFVSP